MKRYLIMAMAAAMALAALYGCSSEQIGAPGSGQAVRWSATKSAGPSEIVLAVDVSDAVTDEQLSALAAAVTGALGDADIVPGDGSIAVSTVVYGDTIAVPYEGLVPVTAENLTGTIP